MSVRFMFLIFGCLSVWNPGVHAAPESETLADADQRQIRRAFKESVRAGHLHHNKKVHFLMYDRNATFVFGRSKRADDHDLTRTMKQQQEFLRRRWRSKPNGHENVFFRSLKMESSKEVVTLRAEIALHGFGATTHQQMVMKLRRTPQGFRAFHVRTWSIFEALGGASDYFTPKHWYERDDDAFSSVMSPNSGWQAILSTCLAARWYTLLDTYLADLSRARPKDAEVWKATAAVAYILGDFKRADRASRKAKRFNPDIDLPTAIR